MVKILVIDDDKGILDAFAALLSSAGYEVETSLDADYLQTLKSTNLPDLILLDVLLSGVDGRNICQWLKTQEKTKHIPVIIVSAHPSADKTLLEIGADDFVAKPFEMNELLAKIEKNLHVHHQ